MSNVPDLLPGTLELLILNILAGGDPMHGYGIAQRLKSVSDEVLQVGESSLYPALQRLLLKGWVRHLGRVREQPPRPVLHADRGRQETAGGRTPGIRPADRRDSQGSDPGLACEICFVVCGT